MLVERERKFDVVALFYTLSLGFAAGSDRSVQAFLERFVEMSDCDELSYATFHGWFSPPFVALLREILDDAIENLDTRSADLSGRLEPFETSSSSMGALFPSIKTPQMCTLQLATIRLV